MAKNPTVIQLTVEEEVERIFRKFDSNGDGQISLTELGAILNGLGSETPADEVARIMSELDTDGDGFIDLKEFKAFHCGGGAGDGAEVDNKELKEAFDLYDQDKNGKISANELHAVLRCLGEKCSLKDCRRMISNVDADGDGCVNFKEFKKMMTRSST
ncbi:calcium binding protein [Striga asiatica]|uniref:Calcium binding protein n=1 Tax=Striga asiatica TaxID=4170 RepID=A0A5A7P653_STRAF|nr:calcium binding protein [Striga asiatica]